MLYWKKQKGMVDMYFLLSLLLVAVGLLMILRPELWFAFTEGWKSRSPEPSDLYLFSTRFGGVMCMLAGSAYIVVKLLMK